MSDKVIPLRPRDQVSRRVTTGATTPLDKRLPTWISGEIGIGRLLRGLATVGLTARVDHHGVVIEEIGQEVRHEPA